MERSIRIHELDLQRRRRQTKGLVAGTVTPSEPSSDVTVPNPFILREQGRLPSSWQYTAVSNERLAELASLQQQYPGLDVGRLLGLKPQPVRGRPRRASTSSNTDTPSPLSGTAAGKIRTLIHSLVAEGVPEHVMLQFVSEELEMVVGLEPQHIHRALCVLAQLMQLSTEAAVSVVIKHPNLLRRSALSLRSNLEVLQARLGGPATHLVCKAYPAALDLSPETVLSHLASLQELLQCSWEAVVAMVVRCPALLGQRPDTLAAKVAGLAASSGLPQQRVLALLHAFPQLLGLAPDTLAAKWRRLAGLAAQQPLWQEQLRNMPVKSLGRCCAVSHAVLDRLQFFLDLGPAGSWEGGQWPPLALSTTLTLSGAAFKSRFPQFLLWQAQQSRAKMPR